jgi:hypothetical protein
MGALASVKGNLGITAQGPLSPAVLMTMISPNVFGHFSSGKYFGPGDPTATYLFAGVLPFFALATLKHRVAALHNSYLVLGLISLFLAFDPWRLYEVVQDVPTIGVLYRPALFYYFIPVFLILSLVHSKNSTLQSGAWITLALLAVTAVSICTVNGTEAKIRLAQGAAILCGATLLVTSARTWLWKQSLVLAFGLCLLGVHALIPNRIWMGESTPNSYSPNTVNYGNEAFITSLRQADQPYRVAVDQRVLGGPFNGGWRVWRIETINGMEPILDREYYDYVTDGLARWWTDRTFGDFDPASEKFNELNVLFLVGTTATTITDSAWTLVYDDWFRVYRNNRFTPRFRLDRNCSPSDHIDIIESRPGWNSLRVSTACNHAVILASERPYRGWHAQIDDAPAEWHAKHPAIGITINIPRGMHNVSLQYKNPAFIPAIAVTAFGLVLILGLLLLECGSRWSRDGQC